MINLLTVIYLAFVSLGLPDGLLGSGWPAMHVQLDTPVAYAGIVSAIIMAGTITSSLLSDRLTHALGAGRVTAFSVAATAAALFGFSLSTSFGVLCLWAVPYGLGAGGVDAAINNYAALYYSSRHMNWLHCMWGLGAAAGPYIMGLCLQYARWTLGYQAVGAIQVVLVAVLFISLPQWKRPPEVSAQKKRSPVKLSCVIRVPGAVQIMLTFFCYCALEQTAMLWSSTYFARSMSTSNETAAFLGSLFLIGITSGRFAGGFIAGKLNDRQMIKLGMLLIGIGIAVLFAAVHQWVAAAGFLIIGLGCAPVYPSVIHSTPDLFGAERSQAVVGIEMASAYVGALVMPMLFGFVSGSNLPWIMPAYLAAILAVMVLSYQWLLRIQTTPVRRHDAE